MLTKPERAVLKAILSNSKDKDSCLISEESVLQLSHIKNFDLRKLNTIVNSLEIDGYFDVIRCKNGNEDMLCITLRKKARSYEREKKQMERSMAFKILLAVLGSITAFLVTRILYAIF